jgi:hypothetical protein
MSRVLNDECEQPLEGGLSTCAWETLTRKVGTGTADEQHETGDGGCRKIR